MEMKGIVSTVVSALLFGLTPILASLTYDMGSTPETVTFYRNLLAIPVLLAVMLLKNMKLRISWNVFGSIALVGVIGCGATTLMLYISYQYVGVGTATTLHFLYPVFVALICRLFYKEHLGTQKIIALIVAGAGILCFMELKQVTHGIGILLAIASGLTYSLYMVGIEKRGLKDISPYKISLYIAIVVSAALLLYNIPMKKIVFVLPPKAFLYIFVIAICTSFLAVALLQLGIKYLNATTAAIFCLLEPITSMITSAVVLGEAIMPQKIIGCLLIILAVIILVVKKPTEHILSDETEDCTKNRLEFAISEKKHTKI